MRAAIITIGDEILIGQTADTNSAWIGSELSKSGFDIFRITTVHDGREDILYALCEVSGKADVVLITGGLGPTSDDITKPVLCEFFNTQLVLNEEVFKMIEEMMARRKNPMNENNRRQAFVPQSCRVLKNAKGTAPGMWFEKDGTIFISMPGVPVEMKYIMTEHVIPELNKRFTSQVIMHRNIMTYGTFEAKLAEILTGFEKELPENIKLAYLPSSGVIKLRLTGRGKDRYGLQELMSGQVASLYKIIPEFIYGENEESLEKVVGDLLREKNQTLCSAESCTGGEIAHLITAIPGCSDYYKGSVIAYANTIKTRILNVPDYILQEHGAVSEEVVNLMANEARKLLDADYCIATSGIAGPDGGTESKPVGTLWMAVASEKGTVTENRVFGTDRITNIKRFSLAALNLLRLQIISG
ncbi:MAG TPA: competence/damage-inducible protein A [Bacteroidales bacterium]|nr:competence/damage-inducible protein A [Bacteroidales bacterium]HBH83400.1 competence/damage-inducible protein A [Bacteroidales bacterium]HCU18262.1 competence/damage-inducible protein A [Bacteroidales bacterium]